MCERRKLLAAQKNIYIYAHLTEVVDTKMVCSVNIFERQRRTEEHESIECEFEHTELAKRDKHQRELTGFWNIKLRH